MKIKRKVEMTPEEYAKYMIDKHGVSGYESDLIDENIIGGPVRFTQTIELNPVSKKDLPNKVFWDGKMTVEVEEEITEDTHLDYLYMLTDTKDVHRCNNFTINAATKAIGRDGFTFFTLVDNDLVKICDKGKLVE